MTFFDLFFRKQIELIPEPISAALGTFDGVHIGHRALIREGAKHRLPLCVFTFEKNPFGTKAITTLEDKLKLFAECGARYACVMDFEEVKDISPEDFVRDILIKKCRCVFAVCGFNYRFGKDGEGMPELLSSIMKESGGECRCVDAVNFEGAPVSSSRIRDCLRNGEIEKASQMLGRKYSLTFPVIHGNELGRTIGFPTVNFGITDDIILPKNGVYITSYDRYACITDIGTKPTVSSDGERICETHIIGASGDYYGQKLTVKFHKRLRDEMKFGSEAELKNQLEKDKAETVEYFACF